MICLLELSKGKKAVVKNINTDKITKERLHSFGLIKGVKVCAAGKAPLDSPKIYKFFNTFIAIRNNIAEKIEVEVEK